MAVFPHAVHHRAHIVVVGIPGPDAAAAAGQVRACQPSEHEVVVEDLAAQVLVMALDAERDLFDQVFSARN